MADDRLINTFEMLCERLGNIETTLDILTRHARKNEMTKYGEIDGQLFGWKFNVYLVPDLVLRRREYDSLKHWRLPSTDQNTIHAFYQVYISVDEIEDSLPTWFRDKVASQNPDRPDPIFHGLDMHKLKQTCKDGRPHPLCHEDGIYPESDYTFVRDEIAARVCRADMDTRLGGVQHAMYGFFAWTRDDIALSLQEWVEITAKIYSKLGVSLGNENTVCIHPLKFRAAEVGAITSEILTVKARKRLRDSSLGKELRSTCRDHEYMKHCGHWIHADEFFGT